MSVGSYLELFTTLIGWTLSNRAWSLLVDTGLAYIPFAIILWKNWSEPSISQEDKSASATSLKRMQWEVYIALFVVMMACVPVWPLAPQELNFHPAGGENVTAISADVTYQDNWNTEAVVKVPLWWAGVLKVTSGINAAMSASLPRVGDIRAAQQAVVGKGISDTDLAHEVQRFATECFQPARNQYFHFFENRTNVPTEISTAIDEWGIADLDWMGSHILTNTPGLYKHCSDHALCGEGFHAQTPVNGWRYNPARDGLYHPDEIRAGKGGKPWCDEWWADDAYGLRKTLLNTLADEGFSITEWANSLAILEEGVTAPGNLLTNIQDAALRRMLNNSANRELVPSEYSFAASNNIVGRGISDTGKTLAGAAGTSLAGMVYAVVTFIAADGMPMIQAILLMLMAFAIPFVLTLGRYQIEALAMMTGAVIFVKSWTMLFFVAWWVDQYLLVSMYPTISERLELVASTDLGQKRMVLDMITASLYIVLPATFGAVLAKAGASAVRGLGEMVGNMGGQQIERAGAAGANVARNTAGGAATRGATAAKAARQSGNNDTPRLDKVKL